MYPTSRANRNDDNFILISITSGGAETHRNVLNEFLNYATKSGLIQSCSLGAKMQITRAADYAVRVMIHIAGLPKGTTVQLKALSTAVDVSETFLAKVLQTLTRAGMLSSKRGPEGGFELVRGAEQSTTLDVITAIEGPIQLNSCLSECGYCERKHWCPAHTVWAEAQIALLNVLNRETLADLAQRAAQKKVATIAQSNDPVLTGNLN